MRPHHLIALLLLTSGLLPSADVVGFNAGNQYVLEANTNVSVTLVRLGSLKGTASVQVIASPLPNSDSALYGLTSAQPAVPGGDFAFPGPMTVTFADGQSLATISLQIFGNAAADCDRAIGLDLANPVDLDITQIQNPKAIEPRAGILIIDDDLGVPGSPALVIHPDDQYGWIEVGEAMKTFRFPVRRSGPATEALTATWTMVDPAGRFDPHSGTLTWEAGSTGFQYAEVNVIDDNLVNPTNIYGMGTSISVEYKDGPRTVSVAKGIMVNDNEGLSAGTIRRVSAPIAREGELANAVLERLGGRGPCTVQAVLLDTDDATLLTTSVDWADGEFGRKSLQARIIDDDLPEGPESPQLRLSIPATIQASFEPDRWNPVVRKVVDQPLCTIPGNDQNLLRSRIGVTNTFMGVVEGGTASITVWRSGDAVAAASVDFTFANGTASDSDWSASPSHGTITWAPGDIQSKAIQVTAVQDDQSEPTETILLTFSNCLGASWAGQEVATINILDDDAIAPIPTDHDQRSVIDIDWSQTQLESSEGSPIVIALVRSGIHDQAVSVNVTTLPNEYGAATPGTDFPLMQTTVFWAAGEMGVKQVAITLPNDVLDESTENFGLHLSSPVGAGRFNSDILYYNPWPLYCYIIDDPEDQSSIPPPPPPPPLPHYEFIFVQRPIAIEKDERVEIQVNRDAGGIGAVTLQWIVLTHPGLAQTGIDIQGDLSGILSWADGETGNQTISIPLLDDFAVDGGKFLDIALVPASGQPKGVAPWGTIYIEDDEPSSGIQDQVYFENTSRALKESENGILTIHRQGWNEGPITVQISQAGGSGRLGEDFELSNYTVTWERGEFDDRTITVFALADSDQSESWEDIILRLDIIDGNAVTGGEFTIYIQENTPNPKEYVYVQSFTNEVVEGFDRTAEFTLGRYGANGPVVVSYTTRTLDSSNPYQAMPGRDFKDTVGSVSWADGDLTEKPLSIPLIDDSASEGWEYFYIEFFITSGNAIIDNFAYVIIKDDDLTEPAGFRFVGSSAETSESRGHQLKIVRNQTRGTAAVGLRVGGTATRNADYLLDTGDGTLSVTFEGDQQVRYITIYPVEDGLGDPNETIILTLVSETPGWSVLSPSSYTVTLGEVADVVSPTVSFLTANGRQIIDTQVSLRSQIVKIEIGTTDNRLVSEVTWKYGVRSGSARILVDSGRSRTWSIDRLPVGPGGDLMVTARDPQGNTTEAKLTIVYAPAKLFSMPGPLLAGDSSDLVDCTMTLLGLHPGDLLCYDRSKNQFIAVGSDEILMPGIGYLLDLGVDPPVFPPPGYHIMTVPTGRVSLANPGWNLVTISGGVQVVWDPSQVEAIINDRSMTLREAIISGYLQAHCWAIDPLTGVMTLITQMPNAVPGSLNTIPAGAGIWIKKSTSASVDLHFIPTTPAGRG